MFKQWMDTVHNQNVFPLRKSNFIMSGNCKRMIQIWTYLEVHSLNSDKVFLLIQLKLFQSSVDRLLKFFAFELFHSY